MTLNKSVTTAADDDLIYIFIFTEKIRLDMIRLDSLCESSARQRIRMNIKPYSLWKIKVKKKLKGHLLQFGLGL